MNTVRFVPDGNAFYEFTMDWRVPIVSSLLYAVLVSYFSRRNTLAGPPPVSSRAAKGKGAGLKQNEPWTLFRSAVVVHNIVLMVFSAYVFWAVTPLLLASFRYRPLMESFCDVGGWAYRHGVGYWTWIFYLSKYYELLDTAILLAKGRPSNFLQTYHHAGAIIGMWMLCMSRAFGAWVFVVLNSFIHTWMYLYYTLTCFGYQPSWKRLMTYMQLTQFFVGLPTACSYVFIPKCIGEKCHSKDVLGKLVGGSGYWSQFLALAFNFSYVAYLVVLFLDFARRSYWSSHSAKQSSATKKSN